MKLITWLFILILSFHTLFLYGATSLQADIILNSIMSLQKLTLYYWGQNRLLNIVPFLTSFFSDSTLNLYAVLFIAIFSFWTLYYVFIQISFKFLEHCANLKIENKNILAFLLLLIQALFSVIFFSKTLFVDILIFHFEYSLSLLLFLLAIFIIFFIEKNEKYLKIFSWGLIFLSIGLNPLTVLVAIGIFVTILFYSKKLRRDNLNFILISITSFFVWNWISSLYLSGFKYNSFSFFYIHKDVNIIIEKFSQNIDLSLLCFFVFTLSVRKILNLLFEIPKIFSLPKILDFVTHCCICFSIFWIIFFSASKWIHLNDYHLRYFAYPVFVLVFILTLRLAYLLNQQTKNVLFSTILLMLFLNLLYIIPSVPSYHLSFKEYDIFKQVNKLSMSGNNFYAGDYWKVWPSVQRDLMNNYSSYGLSYRGEENSQKVNEQINKEIEKKGYIILYCLNDKEENCMHQVRQFQGLVVENRELINEMSIKLKLKKGKNK